MDKYWQHNETGICIKTGKGVITLRRYTQITKKQYDEHERSIKSHITTDAPDTTKGTT